MIKIYYGLISRKQAIEIIVAVCDVLGHGVNNTSVNQIAEICAQETHLGLYRDPTPYSAGTGLSQIDEPTFDDIRDRTQQHNKDAVFKKWGVNIDSVAYIELEHSPLLAIIFTRLFLKLFESEVPATVEDRALWWKSFYNTALGDGTIKQYLRNAKIQQIDDLLIQYKEVV